MKIYSKPGIRVIIAFMALMSTTSSQAVRFHSYVNDEGQTVFSNVPKKCIRQSILTCNQYHPVVSTGQGVSASTKAKDKTDKPGSPVKSSTYGGYTKSSSQRKPNIVGTNSQFDILGRIVEMKKIVDEYFPGNGSVTERNQVSQQQDDIMNVLQLIKKAADPEESQSIQRAIDIFRDNTVE